MTDRVTYRQTHPAADDCFERNLKSGEHICSPGFINSGSAENCVTLEEAV